MRRRRMTARRGRAIEWRLNDPVPEALLTQEGNLAMYAAALRLRGFSRAEVVIAADGNVVSVELSPTRGRVRYHFASLAEALAALDPGTSERQRYIADPSHGA